MILSPRAARRSKSCICSRVNLDISTVGTFETAFPLFSIGRALLEAIESSTLFFVSSVFSRSKLRIMSLIFDSKYACLTSYPSTSFLTNNSFVSDSVCKSKSGNNSFNCSPCSTQLLYIFADSSSACFLSSISRCAASYLSSSFCFFSYLTSIPRSKASC